MESLIKLVTEKAHINEAQAKTAIETVLSFIKEKMPASISEPVEAFITKGSKAAAAGKVTEKLGGFFGE